jgi:hypothetical protein
MKLVRRVARVRDARLTHFRRELRRKEAAWDVGCENVGGFELAEDRLIWWIVCEYDSDYPRVLENWQVIENPRRFLLEKFIIPRS